MEVITWKDLSYGIAVLALVCVFILLLRCKPKLRPRMEVVWHARDIATLRKASDAG
jgi:hypothetical protein